MTTIFIISIACFILSILEFVNDGKSDMGIHGTIAIISGWYIDTVLGIVLLCVISAILILTMASK